MGAGQSGLLGADGGESPVEMSLDGADGHVGDLGDGGEIELFDEAEDKDGALPLGEGFDRLPEMLHLLTGDERGFGRGSLIGDEACELMRVDGGAGNFLPEAEAIGPGVIAHEVERDAGEPGSGGAIAAELVACGPSANEGVLRERFGEVAVAERGEQEAEDALRVQGI